jgi:hypothetical protein
MVGAGDNPITSPCRRRFKTAEQLQVPQEVRDAITSVLGMLERGEMIYATDENDIPHGINMGDSGRDLACWIRSRCLERKLPSSLDPLIHPAAELVPESLTVEEIIAAIKSYIVDGVVRWRGMASIAARGHEMVDGSVGAKAWVAGEIKRMVAAGEICNGIIHGKARAEGEKILGFEGKPTPKQTARLDAIRATDFAKLLEGRMRKAADLDKSARPVKMRYLRNHLLAWGIWPLSHIK